MMYYFRNPFPIQWEKIKIKQIDYFEFNGILVNFLFQRNTLFG